MKIVHGVGLLLFEPTGKMLLLTELISKPHYNKFAGMVTPPLETIEDGETRDKALERLIPEEIGEDEDGEPIKIVSAFFKEFLIKLSDTHSVQLYVYTGTVEEAFVAHPNDTDIAYFGWMHPRELLQLDVDKRRREVEPILRSYLDR